LICYSKFAYRIEPTNITKMKQFVTSLLSLFETILHSTSIPVLTTILFFYILKTLRYRIRGDFGRLKSSNQKIYSSSLMPP